MLKHWKKCGTVAGQRRTIGFVQVWAVTGKIVTRSIMAQWEETWHDVVYS